MILCHVWRMACSCHRSTLAAVLTQRDLFRVEQLSGLRRARTSKKLTPCRQVLTVIA